MTGRPGKAEAGAAAPTSNASLQARPYISQWKRSTAHIPCSAVALCILLVHHKATAAFLLKRRGGGGGGGGRWCVKLHVFEVVAVNKNKLLVNFFS